MSCSFVLFALLMMGAYSLDNGVALTPPMGWMDWERFRCDVDCKKDPNSCIGEKLFMQMADKLVSDGYLAAGYRYVDIDDCWMTHTRDASGRLVANPDGFPSGIPALSKYIHGKGLLFGMYEDIGTKTCGGYPGSNGHFKQDIATFVSWGVDAIKLDGCNANKSDYQEGYTDFGEIVNSTGKKMMYSCSWPAYIPDAEKALYYPYMAKICNIWRNWDDIQDSYTSMASIANYWGDHSQVLSAVAKPGSWNDADQLIIGNSGLNEAESQSQMALWAVMASPLIMSNDLRSIPAWAAQILKNSEVIAVNQDPLGRQGQRVKGRAGEPQVWTRLLADSTYAVVLWNDTPASTHITLDLNFASGVATLRDLYKHQELGAHRSTYSATGIPAHGCVMLKVTPHLLP